MQKNGYKNDGKQTFSSIASNTSASGTKITNNDNTDNIHNNIDSILHALSTISQKCNSLDLDLCREVPDLIIGVAQVVRKLAMYVRKIQEEFNSERKKIFDIEKQTYNNNNKKQKFYADKQVNTQKQNSLQIQQKFNKIDIQNIYKYQQNTDNKKFQQFSKKQQQTLTQKFQQLSQNQNKKNNLQQLENNPSPIAQTPIPIKIHIQKQSQHIPSSAKPVDSSAWTDSCYYRKGMKFQWNSVTNFDGNGLFVFARYDPQIHNKIKSNFVSFTAIFTEIKAAVCIGYIQSSYKNLKILGLQQHPNMVRYLNVGQVIGVRNINPVNIAKFKAGDCIQTRLNSQKGQISWFVNSELRHAYQAAEIRNKNVRWVPFITLGALGDCVQIYQ